MSTTHRPLRLAAAASGEAIKGKRLSLRGKGVGRFRREATGAPIGPRGAARQLMSGSRSSAIWTGRRVAVGAGGRPCPARAASGSPRTRPRGVPFLDAGGVRVLLQCRADARQLDCWLTLAHVKSEAYRVLEIVGLLEPFGVAEPTAA